MPTTTKQTKKRKTVQIPNHPHRQCPNPEVHLKTPIQTAGRLAQKPTAKLPNTKIYHHRALSFSQKIESLLKDSFVDFKSLPDEFVIVIDTTWLKFHVAVEHKTDQVMAFLLIEPSFHDSKKSMELVKKALQVSEKEGKKVKKVLADKGYDTNKMFNFLSDITIEERIMPRKGSKVKGDNSAMDDVVRAVRREVKRDTSKV